MKQSTLETFMRPVKPLTAVLWLVAIGFATANVAHCQANTPTPTCTTATIPVCAMGVTTQDVQTQPMAVPQSTTKVAVVDAYLKGCTINQPIGITVTITTNQASPITIVPAFSPTAATVTVFVWGANPTQPNAGMFTYGFWAPGGFSIVASGTGATFQCAWRQ